MITSEQAKEYTRKLLQDRKITLMDNYNDSYLRLRNIKWTLQCMELGLKSKTEQKQLIEEAKRKEKEIDEYITELDLLKLSLDLIY